MGHQGMLVLELQESGAPSDAGVGAPRVTGAPSDAAAGVPRLVAGPGSSSIYGSGIETSRTTGSFTETGVVAMEALSDVGTGTPRATGVPGSSSICGLGVDNSGKNGKKQSDNVVKKLKAGQSTKLLVVIFVVGNVK